MMSGTIPHLFRFQTEASIVHIDYQINNNNSNNNNINVACCFDFIIDYYKKSKTARIQNCQQYKLSRGYYNQGVIQN